MPSVNARAHGAAVPWPRLFVLLFVVILAVPVVAPPAVEAASLKDQIAAAKERQAALTKSIAKSQRLVAELKADEAQTKRTTWPQTKEDLKDIRADQDAVKARIEKVKERIERIEARHAELVDEQRQTDFTLGLLEQELANGEADLKARRQALGLRLAEALPRREHHAARAGLHGRVVLRRPDRHLCLSLLRRPGCAAGRSRSRRTSRRSTRCAC